MISSDKPRFFRIFFLVFCLSLVLLGSLQAVQGTLRWYNSSEESHENLQKYPIYSASEDTSPIRVTIGQKPEKPQVFAFLPTTKNQVTVVMPSKNPDELVLSADQNIDTLIPPILPFATPVAVTHIPGDISMPEKFGETIDEVLTGTYFRDVLWNFPLTVDIYRLSPR